MHLSPEALVACQWMSDWPLGSGPPNPLAYRHLAQVGGWRWLPERGTQEPEKNHRINGAAQAGNPLLIG